MNRLFDICCGEGEENIKYGAYLGINSVRPFHRWSVWLAVCEIIYIYIIIYIYCDVGGMLSRFVAEDSYTPTHTYFRTAAEELKDFCFF